ncbi:hypothetical protein CK203_072918 [Vitis vinifera]|uniref:Uncharacterized protein n=1 Tax=Vitis vinifera TaxID=29760 RepID=A0A438F240_VITVI|nr:hypothetical protein CK203_072918 [Vitis vinifera]
MEDRKDVINGGENGSSSEGRPPNPISSAYRQCFGSAQVNAPCKKSLVRHPSLVSLSHSKLVNFLNLGLAEIAGRRRMTVRGLGISDVMWDTRDVKNLMWPLVLLLIGIWEGPTLWGCGQCIPSFPRIGYPLSGYLLRRFQSTFVDDELILDADLIPIKAIDSRLKSSRVGVSCRRH